MDPRIVALFTRENLVFVTQGREQPTLYFDDGKGNKGRLRQAHEHGKKLSFQPAECGARRAFITDEQAAWKKSDPDRFRAAVQAAVTHPVNGARVFEYNANTSHLSGGTVRIPDEDEVFTFDLDDYESVVSIWTK